MVNDFYIKTNDLLPYYRATFYDSAGRLDLTGCAVKATMVDDDRVKKVDGVVATVTDATKGEVEYRWVAGDTDTAGDYYIEFEVTSGGKPFTMPSSFRAKVVIVDEY